MRSVKEESKMSTRVVAGTLQDMSDLDCGTRLKGRSVRSC